MNIGVLTHVHQSRLESLSVSLSRPVFEIKDVPFTRCAHFGRRLHGFKMCAPGRCTIF